MMTCSQATSVNPRKWPPYSQRVVMGSQAIFHGYGGQGQWDHKLLLTVTWVLALHSCVFGWLVGWVETLCIKP